jgi:hypothetical protein
MKKMYKLFWVVLVSALMLASCSKLPKGGTIEVKNGLSTTTWVTVIKGELSTKMIGDFLEDFEENGTPINAGKTESFDFDEDGVYAVIAAPPITGFYKFPVTLLGGNTETVTDK